MTISNNKLLVGAAGGGGDPINVEDVFNITLYKGNNTTNNIVNGIDFSGEDGMLWIKARNDGGGPHTIYDTVRGNNSGLRTNANHDAETGTNDSQDLTAFNDDGFSLGTIYAENVNANNQEYCSWSFRKAEKFFDVQTYTGSGENGQTINHDLGVAPGMVWVKSLDAASNWYVYHRSLGSGEHVKLNTSDEVSTDSNYEIGKATATATQFSIDTGSDIDYSGHTYVAYFFAHNNNDGTYGEGGDQDIIKCGGYSGNGGTARVIDIGFEPQFLMIRETGAANFYVFDMMRGFIGGPPTDTDNYYESQGLRANAPSAESGYASVGLAAEGFYVKASEYNVSGSNYIYMAIRRPMKVPESASEVFNIATRYAEGSLPSWQSGFVTDLAISKRTTGSDTYVYDRMRSGVQTRELAMNSQSTEANASTRSFDHMNGWGEIDSAASTEYSWMWRRAPKFFDTVLYRGSGSAGRTVKHNLGVVPEMMWIRNRQRQEDWMVYHTGHNGGTDPEDYYSMLNATDGASDDTKFNDTAPTASVFTVDDSTEVNPSGEQMIAWLFATLPGISKVGSYIGNTTNDRVIDCGFSNGAKYVWIKESDNNNYWFYFDSVRGITTGTDKVIDFSRSDAQADETNYGSAGLIKPDNSGFKISNVGAVNNNDGKFIFYAVAV